MSPALYAVTVGAFGIGVTELVIVGNAPLAAAVLPQPAIAAAPFGRRGGEPAMPSGPSAPCKPIR